MEALDALTSVLYDPEGVVCITGSPADREIVQRSLVTLRARVEKLEVVLRKALEWDGIDSYGVDALWADEAKAALAECEEVGEMKDYYAFIRERCATGLLRWEEMTDPDLWDMLFDVFCCPGCEEVERGEE